MTTSPRQILKNAELHILRDVTFWMYDARSWREAQETLINLRKQL